MIVELNKNYPLEHTADSAWLLLNDIEAVALCMPGAEITEVVDENNFKGKVKIKLGPVKMAFNGDINVKSIDANTKTIQLLAKGKDNKGTSTASMDLTANIEVGDGSASSLIGDAKVTVDGKLAGFGARMMAQVSDQILAQFADNFREKLNQAGTTSVAPEDVNNDSDTSADATESNANESSAAVSSSSSDLTSNSTTTSTAQTSASTEVGSAPSVSQSDNSKSAQSGNEINGLKFAWNILVNMITSLFRRKS